MESTKKEENKVFIATSLDGYIADSKGSVAFLDTYPLSNEDDMGYGSFIKGIDAIIMGRKSFETVLSFDVSWPYTKHVFVWSNTLKNIPENLQKNVSFVSGNLSDILKEIHNKGFNNLYIDGGKVIQTFLDADLIDEMTITIIPVLLGSGIPLFGVGNNFLKFRCVSSKLFENGLSQNVYRRMI